MNRLNNVFSLAGGILVGCVGSVLIVGVTGERATVHAQTASAAEAEHSLYHGR